MDDHTTIETVEPGATSRPGEHRVPLEVQRTQRPDVAVPRSVGLPLFFHAEGRPDGTYTITLTEDGLRTFETALGIANDLGGQTRISTYSTIADIMERTATREELSALMRAGTGGVLRGARITVLRCRLWGSEEPSFPARLAGHVGKLIVVGLILLWTFMQIATATADIAAIPGILANIPHDILNLHPTSAITDVGRNVSDAGTHALYAAAGFCLAYLTGLAVKPLRRIYRHDQIIPAERPVMGALAAALRRAETKDGASSPASGSAR